MLAHREYIMLRPMRSVAKFVRVLPISSSRGTAYDQVVVAIRFFYEIYNELCTVAARRHTPHRSAGSDSWFYSVRLSTSGHSARSGTSFECMAFVRRKLYHHSRRKRVLLNWINETKNCPEGHFEHTRTGARMSDCKSRLTIVRIETSRLPA